MEMRGIEDKRKKCSRSRRSKRIITITKTRVKKERETKGYTNKKIRVNKKKLKQLEKKKGEVAAVEEER